MFTVKIKPSKIKLVYWAIPNHVNFDTSGLFLTKLKNSETIL